jgi:hypothetical protein
MNGRILHRFPSPRLSRPESRPPRRRPSPRRPLRTRTSEAPRPPPASLSIAPRPPYPSLSTLFPSAGRQRRRHAGSGRLQLPLRLPRVLLPTAPDLVFSRRAATTPTPARRMESTTKVFMVTARSDYREWQPRDDEAVHLEAVYSALPSPFSCPAPRRRLGARAHVPLRKKKNTRITPESLNVVTKKRTMVQLT